MIISPQLSVGIIGGSGRTGSQFARLFEQQGFAVNKTGSKTKERNRELIATCDIVIFSVPLRSSTEIMKEEITHASRKDQLFLDVSSLKTKQVAALLKAPGEVIGMHPLFGPWTDPKDETIVLCPGRCEKETLASLRGMLEAMGLRTLERTPEEHDKLMLLLQVLPHFKSLLMADVLKKLNTNLSDVTETCTPAYELEFNIVGRFLDDHADLYGPIILDNPDTERLLMLVRNLLDEYLTMVKERNLDGFTKRYEVLKEFFGDHTKRAREHSEACIRTLTTLTQSPDPPRPS